MLTRIIVLTMPFICGGCALAQEDECTSRCPSTLGRIGEEVDTLDPYFISKKGPPVLFAYEEDRGCTPGDPKVLEMEELRDAEVALRTRVAEPETRGRPCDDFTMTSGKSEGWYNED